MSKNAIPYGIGTICDMLGEKKSGCWLEAIFQPNRITGAVENGGYDDDVILYGVIQLVIPFGDKSNGQIRGTCIFIFGITVRESCKAFGSTL